MTIGTGTFIPAPKYRFPRSYIYELDIARYGTTITHDAGKFTIHAVPPNPTVAIIQFDLDWWLWNSNYRTLDHIVTEFYALVGGVPPQVPLDYTLGWRIQPATNRSSLFFNWFSGSRDEQIFELPVQPPNWWSPRPF